jgi:peptidoglycan hydrolase-like protein with peptidoglycan-binding domain
MTCIATTAGSYINNMGSWYHVAGWYDGVGAPAAADCKTVVGAAGVPLRNEPAVAPGAVVPASKPGANGPGVTALQGRLFELGFWVPDTDGSYGGVTVQAVMAFQKSIGIPATGTADPLTALLVEMQTLRPSAASTEGDLVEIDKTRQLLFVIRDGKPLFTVNTSTGSDVPYTEPDRKNGGTTSGDAHTPEGRFKVYHEFSDGWETGQLGELYRPRYFVGGVAVHGSNSIPNYPASHGCVRVSTTFMDYVWAANLMPMGSKVWVHS